MIHSNPLISIFIVALAVRPLVILLHELGHALIAIYYTEDKATIYLGSHGDREKSASAVFGRLEIWFTGNPFLWHVGVCAPSKKRELTVNQKLIYVLAGPVLPILAALICVYISYGVLPNEYFQFITLTFLGTALIDVLIQLIPVSTPITLIEGTVFNDGYSLKLIYTRKKFPVEYFKAIDHYNKEEFSEATRDFERAHRKRPNDRSIHSNLIECYFTDKRFKDMIESYEVYQKNYPMTSEDYTRLGDGYKYLGEFSKATESYNKA